jgi:hypothetical protein
MNKILMLIIILFLNFNSYAVYKNSFWTDDFYNFIRISNSKIRSEKVIINFSIPFDAVKGVYFGAFYESRAELILTKYIGFNNFVKLGENIPYFKSIDTGMTFYPLSFFKFYFDYLYRDFTRYKIGEHNLMIKTEAIINTSKYFYISLFLGFNFRFVDLNIYDNKTVYKRDWLFNSFLLWKFNTMFHPVYLYSFGFSLGNIDDFEIFSINYWQIDIINYFHLPKGFSIYADGGFGFAGSFVFAGSINRFWVRLGVRYEINIH